MKDITDDELDKLFQDAASHFVPEVDAESAWISMQQELDFPKVKSKMISITILEVSVLLFLLLLSGLVSNSSKNAEIADNQNIESPKTTYALDKIAIEKDNPAKISKDANQATENISSSSEEDKPGHNEELSAKELIANKLSKSALAESENEKSNSDKRNKTIGEEQNRNAKIALIAESTKGISNDKQTENSSEVARNSDLKTPVVVNQNVDRSGNETSSKTKALKKTSKIKNLNEAKTALIAESTKGASNDKQTENSSEVVARNNGLKTTVVVNQNVDGNETSSKTKALKKTFKTKSSDGTKTALIAESTKGASNENQTENSRDVARNNSLKTTVVVNQNIDRNANETSSKTKALKKTFKTKSSDGTKTALIAESTKGISNENQTENSRDVARNNSLKTTVVVNQNVDGNGNETSSKTKALKKTFKTKSSDGTKTALIAESTKGISNDNQAENSRDIAQNANNERNKKASKKTIQAKGIDILIPNDNRPSHQINSNNALYSKDNQLEESDNTKNNDNAAASLQLYKTDSDKKLAESKRRTKLKKVLGKSTDESLSFQNLNSFKQGNYSTRTVDENSKAGKSKIAGRNQVANKKYSSGNTGQVKPDSKNMDESDNINNVNDDNMFFEKLAALNVLKIKEPNLFLDSIQLTPIVFPIAVEEVPSYYQPQKSSSKTKNSLRINIMTSIDLSSVGFKTIDSPGWNLGGTLEYTFMKRLTLISGVIYSVKRYSATGEDYHAGSGWYYGTLNSINGGCTVIDIPVNLRYDVFQKRKFNIFSTMGFSSYIMKKENYNYNFWYKNSEKHSSWEVDNKNKHYFGVVNFSVGYERIISKRVSLQVEPFIKVPLVGVGYNKIDLTTSGMFFSIRYKLR